MTTQEERILDTAVVALERTMEINARVHPVTVGRHRETDAIIEVETDRYKHRFGAEVKTVDRFATPEMLKAQGQALHDPPLLVATYITREVAEHCRQLRLPFIDTAGNAYLEVAGLLVCVVGQARPVEPRQANFRALNPAGLKLTFALLCRLRLLDNNDRYIATAAGMALGTVGADMKDLEARGFFNLETHTHSRKLLDPKRMLEEWATHYPITLRPKLNLGRFRADAERLQHTALAPLNAYWGGEPAAEKLTRYFKPAHSLSIQVSPSQSWSWRAGCGPRRAATLRYWRSSGIFLRPTPTRMTHPMSLRRSWPMPTFWRQMMAAMQKPPG
jgi:hypothetical protein